MCFVYYTLWIFTVVFQNIPLSHSFKKLRINAMKSFHLHLHKISSWQQLRTISLPLNHVINLLLKNRHSEYSISYHLFLEKLILKQWLKIKSSIVDTNNYLNRIFSSFDSLYNELSSSFRPVDNFSDFSFHIVNHKDKYIKEVYLCKQDKTFKDTLLNSKTIIVISDTSIKNNIAILISHICLYYNTIAKTIYHTVNITSTETKKFSIRYRINQAV